MKEKILTLESARLRLRPWEDRDIAPFCAMNACPDVMRFFPDVMTTAQSEEMVGIIRERFAQNQWGLWVVVEKDQDQFLGFTGLNPAPLNLPFSPAVEIGWRLTKAAWGKGYATEAARAVLDAAFSLYHLTDVVAFTAQINQPSERVMQKLGMVRQGVFDHPRVAEMHPLRQHVWYQIQHKNWTPQG
ncbi:GNAT family N-acetyltransferase [Enterobacterales bacterium CwR94]|nr:GNAT family N-acetyltransferase [Enterobacterales bacterium CwR94]